MKKILVIEDNDDIRENILEILELKGYDLHSAADGQDGLELAKEQSPDLIICDVKMPRMSGFELFAHLQKDEQYVHIPFLFVSASAQQKDIDQGLATGAFAYLTKPFTIQELLDLVEAAWMEEEA